MSKNQKLYDNSLTNRSREFVNIENALIEVRRQLSLIDGFESIEELNNTLFSDKSENNVINYHELTSLDKEYIENIQSQYLGNTSGKYSSLELVRLAINNSKVDRDKADIALQKAVQELSSKKSESLNEYYQLKNVYLQTPESGSAIKNIIQNNSGLTTSEIEEKLLIASEKAFGANAFDMSIYLTDSINIMIA